MTNPPREPRLVHLLPTRTRGYRRGRVTLRIMPIFLALVASLSVSNVAHSKEALAVAPAGLENTDGNSFATGEAFSPFRLQSLYLASDFASLPGEKMITDIAFRLDQQETSLIFREFQDLSITLSTTTAGNLNQNFDQNHGADVTVVFDGRATYTFPGSEPADGPHPFSSSTVMQTPFRYDPSEGRNLVVEFTSLEGADTTAILDWHTPNLPYVATVVSSDLTSPEGSTFDVVPVNRFTFVPEPSTVALITFGVFGMLSFTHQPKRQR